MITTRAGPQKKVTGRSTGLNRLWAPLCRASTTADRQSSPGVWPASRGRQGRGDPFNAGPRQSSHKAFARSAGLLERPAADGLMLTGLDNGDW